MRDDRPFGGRAPPAALYYASRDRRQEHPERHLRGFTGILQADAYSGYNTLYDPSRAEGTVTPALCWAHARRPFFDLADIGARARRGGRAPVISPVALQAVRRVDALFNIERTINSLNAAERLSVRQTMSAPVVPDLEAWPREEHARLSRLAAVAKPMDYTLKRWDRFAAFLEDGRICLTNNAAERALLDHNGSVSVVTDDEGKAVTRMAYAPYGEEDRTEVRVWPADETRGYIGEHYDPSTGLLYLNAQYFDPVTTLFISGSARSDRAGGGRQSVRLRRQ